MGCRIKGKGVWAWGGKWGGQREQRGEGGRGVKRAEKRESGGGQMWGKGEVVWEGEVSGKGRGGKGEEETSGER